MNALHAGSLGIAAALAGALTDPAAAQAADAGAPEPVKTQATEGANGLLDLPPPEAGPRRAGADRKPDCDGKCKVLALTEDVLPGVGASDLLGVLLYPEERGVSITNEDGTAKVTFTVMPTKLGSGKGLVAIGRF